MLYRSREALLVSRHDHYLSVGDDLRTVATVRRHDGNTASHRLTHRVREPLPERCGGCHDVTGVVYRRRVSAWTAKSQACFDPGTLNLPIQFLVLRIDARAAQNEFGRGSTFKQVGRRPNEHRVVLLRVVA